MKIQYLVTGANGFIGSHLVDALLNQEIQPENIRLLLRTKHSANGLPKGKFDYVIGDIRDKTLCDRATKGVNIIYHLAAASGFDANDYKTYKEINVDGTQNLLSASRKEHIQKFVFCSTIAVYGLPAHVGDIINWNETHEKTFSEIYGRSKYEAERCVQKAYNVWKIPFTIVRPTSVYGPRDKDQLFALYKAIKKRLFFIVGDGKNMMDFVFVKDLVQGIIQAQKTTQTDSEYILGSCNPIQFREIVSSVAKSIDVRTPSGGVPKNLALLAANTIDKVGGFAFPRSDYFSSKIKIITSSYYYDCSKAKKEIGYAPATSFAQGANITGAWYLRNKFL